MYLIFVPRHNFRTNLKSPQAILSISGVNTRSVCPSCLKRFSGYASKPFRESARKWCTLSMRFTCPLQGPVINCRGWGLQNSSGGRGGGQVKFHPNKKGDGKSLSHAEGEHTKFRGSFTKGLYPLRREGGHERFYPVLRGGDAKGFGPILFPFCSPPPPPPSS